ncbi:BTB/POZ domain protein [Aphelenchoides avenae]|nr:BTB/POZ domain protein [Aphelenchus avenae]
MTAEEFAEGPAGDAILTEEEKVQVFRWFTAAIPQSIFPDTPRYAGESYVCERLPHGGGFQPNYPIVAKLALGSTVVATKTLTGTVGRSSTAISVNFDKPIKIKAAKRYTASVVVTGHQTYYGGNGTSSKTVATKSGDVVFSLMQSDVSSNTNVTQGMIPQIAFRI